VIGGYSYGFSAATDIRSPDGRMAWFGFLVPKDQRASRRERFARGQLGWIDCEASFVRDFGELFLNGDWALFEKIYQVQQSASKENVEAWQKQDRGREMVRAVTKADAAFKAGHYAEAEAALKRFQEFLPPSQIKKLALARARLKAS
jgi:hypothetical protein